LLYFIFSSTFAVMFPFHKHGIWLHIYGRLRITTKSVNRNTTTWPLPLAPTKCHQWRVLHT
jgi:hypothetical protein